MRRGFKTEAEKAALAVRLAMKQSADSALDPWRYAEHKGVLILDTAHLDIPDYARKQLFVADYESWSALTIREDDVTAIIINPSHARTRQANDLTHELAHLDLKHVPNRVEVSPSGLLLLSDYSDEQEQEADWYAGALLLPRDALAAARRRQRTTAQIAQQYRVSEKLCEWRIRMTGVDVQMYRARRAS
jgi:Zn-dependent peptidase ImmA (M78 family)